MSRFREKSKGTKTINRAGGNAYKQSSKLELVSLVLTSFLKDKFYESANSQLDRLVELVKGQKDKEFVAKTAIYARNEFGMRTTSHILTGELVKQVKGQKWMKNFINKVTKRPDDLLEILGYYMSQYGKPIPNSFKKGANLALQKFDAYQLAKYRSSKSSLKLVDLFNLVRPKAKDVSMSKVYKDLVSGNLKSRNTWESKLSQAGKSKNKEEAKAKAWADLVLEGKIGYFALLRNLRNILEQADDNVIDKAIELLTDRKAIKKSLVMPFRYLSATYEVSKVNYNRTRDVIVALAKACEISLDNVPRYGGKTLVVLDVSGSMGGKPIEIGSLFASVLYKANNADLVLFAETAEYCNLNPTDSISSMQSYLVKNANGGGTNFHSPFELVGDKKYDRIIILSDMQGWMDSGWSPKSVQESFNEYKQKSGANPYLYSFDLQGYGDMQFPENNVFCLAGWSDKIFDVMKLLEQDKNALVNEIDKIKL